MAEPLRIVIADDNYLVREGTRRLLEDSGQVTVQAAVGSAPELLDAVQRSRADAVLTDIRMPLPGSADGRDGRPAMEGIDAAHSIKAADPGGRRGHPLPVRRRVVCVRAVPQRHRRAGVPAQGPGR